MDIDACFSKFKGHFEKENTEKHKNELRTFLYVIDNRLILRPVKVFMHTFLQLKIEDCDYKKDNTER